MKSVFPSTLIIVQLFNPYLTAASAPDLSATDEAVSTAARVVQMMPAEYQLIAQLQPLGARDIGFSLLGIGGETMDRDYTDFDSWKQYLEPLGAKWVRLQSGWAKTEPVRGQYDYAWLDHIIDGCLERGVQPWLSLSYGNPIYPEGGYPGLFGGFVRGEQALAAWDRYVRTTVRRYQDRVHVYEIWNEADARGNKAGKGEYARLFLRTARIVREEHPGAQILGLGLAHVSEGANGALREFVDTLEELGGLGFVDGITVHGYPYNPDDYFSEVAEIRAFLDLRIPGAAIWQGETGAAAVAGSERAAFPLEWGIPWNEVLQAKWNLRRALSHIARGIPYNQFTIADYTYTQSNLKGACPMGLLETRDDRSVAKPRLAYFAYRNVCTVFSNGVRAAPEEFVHDSPDQSLQATRFLDPVRGRHLLAFWDGADIPQDGFEVKTVRVTMRDVRMSNPVLVDLLTGQVFSFPPGDVQQEGLTLTLRNFPLWDSPFLVCDRSLLPLNASSPRPRQAGAK